MTNDDMVLFTRFGMGEAPPDLQHKLVGIFLGLLNQDSLPGVIAFYGEGVKLTCLESPALEALKSLADKGSRLVVCQTCLDHYNLRDKVRVGIIGGMGDIVHAMNGASKVISV